MCEHPRIPHDTLTYARKLFNELPVINCSRPRKWNTSELAPADTMLDLSCPSSAPSIGPPQSRIPPAHDHFSPFYAQPLRRTHPREDSARRR
jgi:hypothetical protein